MADNHGLPDYDPFMGMGMDRADDGYMGAGDGSLFDEPESELDAAPRYSVSPAGVLNPFDFGDMSVAPQGSDPAGPGPEQRGFPVGPALQGLRGHPDASAAQSQNTFLYLSHPHPFAMPPQTQDPYPLGPLQGHGNGANQGAGGNAAQPYGLSPTTPNRGQFGYHNFQPQYRHQGQHYAPNMGYQGNSFVPVPMQYLPMPAYLPAQAQDAYQPPLAVPNLLVNPNPPANPNPPENRNPQRHRSPLAPIPAAPISAAKRKPGKRAQAVHIEGRLTHHRKLKGDPRNDPSKIYRPPTGLAPWGPMTVNGKGKDKVRDRLFQYFRASAELKPHLAFTKEQLVIFMKGEGHPNPDRRLTLWIQNVAAQSNDRYASGSHAARCRYIDCPGSSRTILKGFYRMAFDEASDLTGSVNDPLQNAGYMHLHCFEKLFDLPYLIHYGAARHGFTIRPDTRQFQYETRHPAALNRDNDEMINAYNEWLAAQKPRADFSEAHNATLPPDQPYTGFDPVMTPTHYNRLGYKLTMKHMEMEGGVRSKTREKRGGIHIGVHKGDLELYNRLKWDKRKKRKAKEEEDDEDDYQQEAEVIEDEIQVVISDNEDEETTSRGTRSSPAQRSKGKAKVEFDELYDASPRLAIAPPRHHFPSSSHVAPQMQQLQQPAGFYPPRPPSTPTTTAASGVRRTRKRSRETSQDILAGLASQGSQRPMTRSSAHAIQACLSNVPPHMQQQVLAVAAAAGVALPAETVGHHYNDHLEERLGRLPKRQRREVEAVVGRKERIVGLDGRKGQSF